MKNQWTYCSTPRAAEIFGVKPHTMLNDWRRKGHYRNVVPRKGGNGRLHWAAVEVCDAAGLFPAGKGPAALLRGFLIAAAGVDALVAHRVSEALLSRNAQGDTSRQRIEGGKADARLLCLLIEAFGARVGDALTGEQHMTPDDWADFNAAAAQIDHATERARTPMRWQTPSTAAPVSMFTGPGVGVGTKGASR